MIFLDYMEYDPVFRGAHHNELTFSMVYAYSERFLLGLSHDEFVHEKKSLIEKMPGDDEQKFSNMRAALTYMVCHPGKNCCSWVRILRRYRNGPKRTA